MYRNLKENRKANKKFSGIIKSNFNTLKTNYYWALRNQCSLEKQMSIVVAVEGGVGGER